MEQSVAAGEVLLRALRALGPAAPIGIEQELAQPGKPLHACAAPGGDGRWRLAAAQGTRIGRSGTAATHPKALRRREPRERLQGVE
jgi:hypothetical protein